MKTTCLSFVFVLLAAVASAQTPLPSNPGVTFHVGAEYTATLPTGEPLVSDYQLEIVSLANQGNPDVLYLVVDLGKPPVDETGHVTVAVPQLLTITPNTDYVARLYAVGSTGVGVSGLSADFELVHPGPPAAPDSLVIVPNVSRP